MRHRSAPIPAALLAALLALPAAADDRAVPDPVPGVLNLRTGDVDTRVLPSLLADDRTDFTLHARYVVRLDGPMTPERRAALTTAGARLGDYLPSDSFIADLSACTSAGLRALGFVAWVGVFERAWAIAPEVLGGADAAATVIVHLFQGAPADEALARLSAINGVVVLSADANALGASFCAVIPKARLREAAAGPTVQMIEPAPVYSLRNSTDRWIVQTNVPNSTPLYAHGITGVGQVIGICDQKVAVTHCSFVDTVNPIGPLHRKILAYNTTTGYGQHGTHVAGTVCGDAGVENDTRGVAYGAKLVYNTIPSPQNETNLFTRFSTHHTQGATVHTNSWGNDGTTAYDGSCRGIDNFSWQNDTDLVLFAVTNLSSLKNPENAKNCMGVAASQDTPNQGSFCSGGAGPTTDQRRKPEITAPGCGTNSSTGSTGCSTAALTGTSMACPAVAGAALLVRQYFTDGFYPTGSAVVSNGFTPSGALVKAMLLNSAQDMTGIAGYPSNTEGWGRVTIDQSVAFPGDSRTLVVRNQMNNQTGALSTGQSILVPVAVQSNETLRVTLSWHDYPGAVNSTFAPVNNLDLTVTAPNGTVYLGNVFTSGFSSPGGASDIRNNVEQVHIPAPAAGVWTVRVAATAVNQGTQGFGLAISGAVAEGTLCVADFDHDMTVTSNDVTAYLNAWFAETGGRPVVADIDGDGDVNSNDIAAFLNLWFASLDGC